MPSFAPIRICNFTRASDLALFRENTNFSRVIISIYLRVQSHIRTVSFSGLSNGCQTDVTNHVFGPTLCKFKKSIICRRNKSTSVALRTSLALMQSTCGKSKSTCVFFGNPPRGLTKMKPYPGCHFFLFSKKAKKKKRKERNNNNNKMIRRKEEITYTFVFIIYRGYYMAARRYESFSSSVEKYFTSERSKRVKYFQHEKRNFVSPSDHVMLYLLYKHQ